MKILPANTEKFINNPDLSLLAVLLYGPDSGLVSLRFSKLVKHVADEADPFLVTEIEPDVIKKDASVLADEMTSISMTGGRRVIKLREAGNTLTKELTDIFENLKDIKGNLAWLVVAAGDLDNKSTLRKLFESHPRLAAIACYQDDMRSLPPFISQQLQAKGITSDKIVIDLIASRSMGDRMLAVKAIDKLDLYLGSNRRAVYDDVEKSVGDATESAIDDLADAMFSGKPELTIRHYEKCQAQGLSEVAMLRTLQKHCQKLMQAVAMVENGSTGKEAATKQRIFWKRETTFIGQIEKLTGNRLSWNILHKLVEAEKNCKGGHVPPNIICCKVLLEIASELARSK
jgi:DNA polymerase III subunit delta